MDMERRERAKSIRAARDWLTGAEDAIAGEDDLAGDLKVMLARAELARMAADRRACLRRWGLRLLPPLAAAAVLAYILWQPPTEEMSAPARAQSAEQRVEAPAPVTEKAARQESSPAEYEPPSPAERPVQQPVERVQEQPPAADASVPPPAEAVQHMPARVPDADMQRLMQVGGKILRE